MEFIDDWKYDALTEPKNRQGEISSLKKADGHCCKQLQACVWNRTIKGSKEWHSKTLILGMKSLHPKNRCNACRSANTNIPLNKHIATAEDMTNEFITNLHQHSMNHYHAGNGH